MKALPLSAKLFVGSVVGLAALLFLGLRATVGSSEPLLFFVLLALSSLTSVFKVNLPLSRSESSMSVAYAVDFAALLLLGPNAAMLIAATSAWSQCTFRMNEPNPPYRTLFSMACLAISVQVAGRTYAALGGQFGSPALEGMAGPLVGAATSYFVANTVLVAGAIALTTRQRVRRVWHENFLWSAPSYFVGAGVAALAASLVRQSAFAVVPVAVIPLFLTYRAYKVYLGRIDEEQRQVREMSSLHLATVEALAQAIDAKDRPAPGHLRRVQEYAAVLGRLAGMSAHEIQGVKTAALLHDIGHLAIPDHILSKPGELTPEEQQKMRIHPKVGADIIGIVPFPYPVAPLILGHHERWDGQGYPAGLKGEDIPLGARILAVVDHFDSLMSDRPYHKARSYDVAVAALRKEAGRRLDPNLVALFIRALPELRATIDTAEGPVRRASVPRSGEAEKRTPPAPKRTRATVFDDIALAHREIYALYEIAQALGKSLGVADTMTLISSKLRNLVPFSCCAIFLYDEASDTLQCRFATGTDAETVLQIGVHSGDGLTGWVARNRTPLLNGRPAADLEAAGLESLPMSLRSALICPLALPERFIGTLAVYHVEPDFYRDDHRRLLDQVSQQAAAVINNSILFEQTQSDSLTDPLTNLPNTRYLYMHLTSELARSERLRTPVSLLVMDLDNFKEINDEHGHHIGDRALCEIARVLRAGIRPYDVCIRYAGDEFIVVLSGCGAEEAERKRLELQTAVEELYFEPRPGKRLHLGISIGLAVFPEDGEVYESLLAAADGRMYQDKTERKRRSRDWKGRRVAQQHAPTIT